MEKHLITHLCRGERDKRLKEGMRPIWETASRPLFVRSVWQETIGRRHFILDYEPRQRQRWKRQQAKRGENHQQTQSCEYFDRTLDDSVEYLDEDLLLDATKLTLQQQQQQQQQQSLQPGRMNSSSTSNRDPRSQHFSRQAKRRAWLLSRGKTYQSDHYHNHNQLNDHQSRRSSLQDTSILSMTANNPEDRLAERVLNWLDLAGRTDIVKSPITVPQPPQTNSAQLSVRTTNQRYHRHNHRSVSLKRIATAVSHNHNRTNHQRTITRKPNKQQQQQQQQPQSPALNHTGNNPSSVNPNAKPITIIFNKEGIPVRLNRPARNIDLCTLSNSASTTRRLAGQLASARLYNGGNTTSTIAEDLRSTPPQSSRGLTSTISNALDSRKQLHIFMPSLPKKGLLNATGCSDDGLSSTFSELCQM